MQCVNIVYFKKFFYTPDARNIHRLGDLHGICTPRSYHLFARTNKKSLNFFFRKGFGPSKEPGQFFIILNIERAVCTYRINDTAGAEKDDHVRKGKPKIKMIFNDSELLRVINISGLRTSKNNFRTNELNPNRGVYHFC